MQPIPLPAPYGGIDERTPVIALESPFCENLLNFNVVQTGLKLRNGDSKYRLIANGASLTEQLPLRLFVYGQSYAFALILDDSANQLRVFDIDGNVVLGSFAETNTSYLNYFSLFFNNYLFFFTGEGSATPGFVYNGSTIAAIGYTGAGFTPLGGNVYKQRAYIIQYAEAAYWYSGIDAVSGALTKVDLTTVITLKARLSGIATFSISDNISSNVYQAFIFDSGEILFYQGSYPADPNWALVGRSFVGSPIGMDSNIAYQGDVLLFCDNGIISLKDLFLRGSQNAQVLSVNVRVQKTWVALIKAMRSLLNIPVGPLVPAVRGIYDSKNNRIIISFPYYLNSSGVATPGSFFFIFDSVQGAWYYHRSFGPATGKSIIDITNYKGKVLMMCPVNTSNTMIYEKEGASGFTDRSAADAAENGYDYEVKMAPVSGDRAYVLKAEGLDVIIESDLYSETNYQLISDLGVGTTTAQLAPSQPTGVQKPLINMGIEGSYIQPKISGTTTSGKSVGYNLYGLNLWKEQGGNPR